MENQRTGPLKIFVVLLTLIITVIAAHGSASALASKAAEVATTSNAAFIDQREPEPGAPDGVDANCRYGVALMENDHLSWFDDLRIGWYLNFHISASPAPNDAEFVPVIALKQDRDEQGNYLPTYTVKPPLTDNPDGLGALIYSRQGALWIVGNEVDRAHIQGDTYPDVYAQAYHDVYHFIKQRDPSAQVGISALVQISPGRLQYLDMVWDAYVQQYQQAMPVDVWNMHLYILPEKRMDGTGVGAHVALGTDPDLAILESGGDASLCPRSDVHCVAEHDKINLFAKQVQDMRLWMKQHGERNKPLIISEYSILYVFLDYDDPINPTSCYVQDEHGNCFTQQRVSDFMKDTFDYLDSATDPELGYPLDGNRLVQQWLWYASHVSEDETGGSSNLLNAEGTALTEVGQTFKNKVLERPLIANLLPAHIGTPAIFRNGASTVDAQLSVEIINNGNRNAGFPFTVTFYKDAGMTQVIDSITIPGPDDDSGMMACARRTRSASVTWTDLTPGLHRYWFRIDSSNSVIEGNEDDNTGSGFVLVDPLQSYLPVIRR